MQDINFRHIAIQIGASLKFNTSVKEIDRVSQSLLMDIDGAIYRPSIQNRLNIAINGLLYSFRNDRVHGGSFSPFRSSKASLRTYAHSTYSFLLTYYLLLSLLHFRDGQVMTDDDALVNLDINLNLYRQLYGNNIKN